MTCATLTYTLRKQNRFGTVIRKPKVEYDPRNTEKSVTALQRQDTGGKELLSVKTSVYLLFELKLSGTLKLQK